MDIIAEGMLPPSFVELFSVIQAYSNIAPEFQARITLTVMAVGSLHYRSQSTSISAEIRDFHLSDNFFHFTGQKLSHAVSGSKMCMSIQLIAP